ncbi:MAG TPA: hypothetical protein PKG88_01075 [Bacteroidales bacterium]|jgi:hypothetical protein|nr:hypothetical protein [Bacteroidales bacterium]HPS71561.1 hypothetical protein [Bacteroidales bacterium]
MKVFYKKLKLIQKNLHARNSGIQIFLSVLLSCALFLPSIVKLEHHHDHFECKAVNEKHFHNFHPKCETCSFEFSFFASEPEILYLESDSFVIIEKAGYCSLIYSLKNNFNFLLRAPPIDFYLV